MALRTPHDQTDNLHGEQEKEPLFSGDEGLDNGAIYDDQKTPLGDDSDPRGEDNIGAGKSSDPRNEALNPEQLADKENSGSDDENSSQAETDEKNSLYTGTEKPGKLSSFRQKFTIKTTRRKASIGIVAAMLGLGGFGGFAILQGPMQFVHMAQLLQKHFRLNEDFGDERGSKVLLYSLLDKGAQNGRLGMAGNKAADKWEKNLLENTGMRPVYTDGTRRFAGFEIVDEEKAFKFLDSQDGKNRQRIENSMGKGAEIANGNNKVINSDGERLGSDRRFLDLSNVNFSERRKMIKTIGKATSIYKVPGSVASRLLIKRGGVNFHPLNKIKDKTDKGVADFLEKRNKNITDGSLEADGPNAKTQTNADGKEVTPEADVKASGDTKSFIDDFKKTGAFKTASSGAVVVGVLCTAKSVGNNVADYKYKSNYLPMLRLGGQVVTTGNQVMSGDDLNMDSLKVMNQFMYDKQKKTSWTQAASVRAENGQTGGVAMPNEARLSSIEDKPKLFDVLDKIPGLGEVCGVQDTISNLPIISNVSNLAGSIVQKLADQALSLGGTSTNDLMESAMKAIAGKAVDPNAKGADFGNLANAGAFYAANDAARARGGLNMTAQETATLNNLLHNEENSENNQKSFYAKYIDPKNSMTIFGSLIDLPAQSIVSSNFENLSNFPSMFFAKTYAQNQTTGYDYGETKVGFSLEERADPRFEDPFANAKIVIPQLDELNARYSKCFGMKITVEDNKPVIENGETVNPFSNDYKDECKKNNDEMFLRYRFYINDVVTGLSLDCYEGDEDACQQLYPSGSNTVVSEDQNNNAGIAGDLLKTITISSPGEFITLPKKYSCPGRTTEIDSRIAPALAYILDTYNMCADDGLKNGHRSHGAGFGVDVRPKDQAKQNDKNEWKNTAEKFLRDINWWGASADQGNIKGCAFYSGYGTCVGGASGPNGKIPTWVRWLGYNGDIDHGDPWHVFGGSYAHIHIGWQNPSGDTVSPNIISSPRSNAYTFAVPIPDDIKGLLSDKLLQELQAKSPDPMTQSENIGSGSSDLTQLAQQLIQMSKNGKINIANYSTNPSSDTKDRSLASLQLADLAAGKKINLSTRCSDRNPSISSPITPNPKILQFLVELGQSSHYELNTLAGQCHRSNSNHYHGTAVDFGCSTTNTSEADKIGIKYGISRNNENCANNGHWHYSIGGN